MKATRYEFGDTGIFHAYDFIEQADLTFAEQEDLEWAQRQFEEYLNIPDEVIEKPQTTSFFTKEGLDMFADALDVIINLFYDYPEEAGLGELKEIEIDIPQDKILYQDDYQIVISKTDYEELKKMTPCV